MNLSKCSQCEGEYAGPVCPRCAVENARRPPASEATTESISSPDDSAGTAVANLVADRAETLGESDLLGHFQIVKFLGEGGMSRVYEALDTKLNRRVAIKIPKANVLRDPLACEWFTQEGQSIARMRDRHVVRVHHSQEFDGIPCHVMEFIEGESLSRRIAREERLPADEAAKIGRDIALGLLEVHVHGRIHGDIKPSNVIVNRRQATIVDFGLARQLTYGDHDARVMAGTPEYMPPERARGESSGISEDVYSLGCTVFEMLAGSPYQHDDATTAAVTDGEMSHPSTEMLSHVPKSLAEIVMSLVADDPIDRPASAKEVAQLFDGWLARKRKTRRRVWLIAASAMLLCASLIYYLTSYPRGDIAILAVDGSVRQLCQTLGEAVLPMEDGEILELRSEGPFTCDAAIFSDKPLTIRAAAGCSPLVELRCTSGGKSPLHCLESLALEGVVVRCYFGEGVSGETAIKCEGDSLRITNCRFEAIGNASHANYVAVVGSETIAVRDSFFAGCGGTALSWEPEENSHLSMENCLSVGPVAVEYLASSETAQYGHARLEHCTFVGDHVLVVAPSLQNRFESAPDTPTRVEARSCVFRTSDSLVLFDGWSSDRDPALTMASHLDWRDAGNIHASDSDRCVCWQPAGSPSASFRADCLTAWTPHWGMTLEDVDAVFVLGGNITSFFGEQLHAQVVRDLIQRLAAAGKLLGGIGDGPAVLADGGLLDGRRAAVQPRFQEMLEKHGAIVLHESPVQDGNILTADSNFHMAGLVGLLPEKPLVLAIIAEKDFWFDDYRAAKYEVERAGGTLLTVSSTVGTARPDKAGGGSAIYPDLLLPLLRHDGGRILKSPEGLWPTIDLASLDPTQVTTSQFRIPADAIRKDSGNGLPGVVVEMVGPGGSSTR